MHTHIFSISSISLFLFLGLGLAQPTWAGLSPASPARTLAQASDPARPQHAWTSLMRAWRYAKVINYLGTVPNALNFQKKKKTMKAEEAYLVAGCFAGVLACRAVASVNNKLEFLLRPLPSCPLFPLPSSEKLSPCSVFFKFSQFSLGLFLFS